jgi:hypothetical protein
VVAFLHGGSPFKVWQPDSFRIRLNRRSTFNYCRDILHAGTGEEYRTTFDSSRTTFDGDRRLSDLHRVLDYLQLCETILTALSIRVCETSTPGGQAIAPRPEQAAGHEERYHSLMDELSEGQIVELKSGGPKMR